MSLPQLTSVSMIRKFILNIYSLTFGTLFHSVDLKFCFLMNTLLFEISVFTRQNSLQVFQIMLFHVTWHFLWYIYCVIYWCPSLCTICCCDLFLILIDFLDGAKSLINFHNYYLCCQYGSNKHMLISSPFVASSFIMYTVNLRLI